jgi:hypothetical protein
MSIEIGPSGTLAAPEPDVPAAPTGALVPATGANSEEPEPPNGNGVPFGPVAVPVPAEGCPFEPRFETGALLALHPKRPKPSALSHNIPELIRINPFAAPAARDSTLRCPHGYVSLWKLRGKTAQ